MEKPGRNDPCPCGSGKKFKKCCESKMIGKRFSAHKIESSTLAEKAAGLSKLFQSNISEKPPKIPPDSDSSTEKP